MSKINISKHQNVIEKMITELCPEGVTFKELYTILEYEQPDKYIVNSTIYGKDFATPVLTAGQSFILGYTNEIRGVYEASKEYPTIIFDDFTTSFHWVDFNFKVKSSAMKMIRPKSELNLNFRFVYYAMKCIDYIPKDHARHWISQYSKYKIPFPPIKVQNEIVKILDTFAELEAELEAEHEARKKQYDYYREKLMYSNVEAIFVELKNIANYSKTRIAANSLDADSYVGVDNLLQNRQGKTTSSYVPKIGNLTRYEVGDILIGNIRPYLKKIWQATNMGGTNGDVLTIHLTDKAKEKITSRYLYHLLASNEFFNYNMKHAKGAKMPRGNKEAVMKYKIPIIDYVKQVGISKTLDKFDALVNDISIGLPAELNARRQQYEYYRNKLLTFKEYVN